MATIVDEIRLVLEAKAAALLRRNSGDLATLIHANFVYVNATGRNFDKSSYIDTYSTSGKIVFRDQQFSDLDVKQVDEFAVAVMSTQGITDLVGKLLMLSQIRAIACGLERMTPALIRSVAIDCFRLVKPLVDALRKGDYMALIAVDDLVNQLDPYICARLHTARVCGSAPGASAMMSNSWEIRYGVVCINFPVCMFARFMMLFCTNSPVR